MRALRACGDFDDTPPFVDLLIFCGSNSVRWSALGDRGLLGMPRIFIELAESKNALKLLVHFTSGIAPERVSRRSSGRGSECIGYPSGDQ